VKVDPVAAQETKQRIEITQMNRTIKKMQNEITKLRRGDNYVVNPRMHVPEKRRNPPQGNRVRLENMDNTQRPRVPRQPTPNAVVLDDVYDEKMVEKENYYSPDEISETVQMYRCETSMYIFEEGDNDPNSYITHTRGFVNRSENKNDFEKENEKDKEKTNEKMIDSIGSKKKHPMSKSTQMTYNVVEDLSKLSITLPFTEVVKIPQQRKKKIRLLDAQFEKVEVVISSLKESQNTSTVKLRGKIHPFYISIENHDVALHNCLVDTGEKNNIMPLVVMEALGMNYTKYYETCESIYAIDSIKVPAYGEIKEFYALIMAAPHIITVFNMIVVDLPPAYGVFLGRYWSSMIEGYIMNDGSCMMLLEKEGVMIKEPCEPRKPFSFKNKYNELMEDYIDIGVVNYAILEMEHSESLDKIQDTEN
jgi:hypothetical protein